jgi:predicted AlkP superfamily phosphohydrolase/phosphomutase
VSGPGGRAAGARRVFLLGIDGASWNVLDRLVAVGAMPNLARLAREGVRATLESTVPPITPVAWLSLMTGCNPGRHGVYGFLKPSPDNSYLPAPVNRADARVPTIFDYFREGGPLVSLNLPMSWPATPINGAMITCMMTPLRNPTAFEHPAGLLARLARAGIDYVIDPKFKVSPDIDADTLFRDWQASGREFVDLLLDMTRQRMDAVRLLMDEEPWDAFICVLVGADRIQHLHWDRLLPDDGADPDPLLVSWYRYADERIGELAGRLRADDTLLIVSDHGFTRTHGKFLANEWLRRQGLLARREARHSPLYPLKRALGRLGVTRRRLGRVLGEKASSRLQLAAAHVDWARSEAYLDNPFGIRVNLQGRETLGRVPPARFAEVRDRIVRGLREVTDAEGRHPIAAVRCREELYAGDAADGSSDVIFTFRDDLNWAAYDGECGGEVFVPTPHRTGDHRIDGVFVAWGGGVRTPAAPGELRFRIQDVLPTLLHLNGRPVPEICDGRVLSEILADPREPVFDRDWRRFQGERCAVAYGPEQETELRERLRALGYLADD